MPHATVRWFDTERGFGFLDLGEEGDDLFVHVSEVVGAAALREGQEVEYEPGEGDRGPVARRVRVVGDVAADATLGVLGTVSWYEPAKGYGFVAPEDGGPEVFLHSSAIVGGGVVHEGQRVAFLVVPGEKGPQADHLLPLAASAGPAAAAVDDGADGTVTFFDTDKGFGFIRPDDGGDDLFVHAKAVRSGVRDLVEGDRVTYSVTQGDRGPLARDVDVVGGHAHRPAHGAHGHRDDRRGDGYRGDRRGDGRGDGYRDDRRGDGRRGERSDRRGGAPRGGAPVRGGEGEVVRYDPDRGFGFIRPDDGGDDLFVHVSVVRGGEVLEEGDRVRYAVRQSDRGPQADRVDLL